MSVSMTALFRPALAAVALTGGVTVLAPKAEALQKVPVASFSEPIDIRSAPGSSLLYVVEKPGRIMLIRNGAKLAQPFLDITGLVEDGGEQGLLSLAFPPDYRTTRLFYVLYVNNAGDVTVQEFRRSTTDPQKALPGSRRRVLTIPHPIATNHNGGQLHFDGYGRLYISIGDGGNPCNCSTDGEPARRLDSLLGKILRIYPKRSGTRPYTIPQSNPFVGKTGRDEIFAYGLRNPYRMSLESTGIFIADVGQDSQEEVSARTIAGASGANFGWPAFEGTAPYRPTSPGPGPHKPPIHSYSHAGGNCAIVGGYVSRDPQLPALSGRYLYADNCVGQIRSFLPNIAGQTASGDRSEGLNVSGIYGFGRGANGQIFALGSGTVYRIEP